MEQENRNQQNAAPQVSLGDQIKVRREKLAQLQAEGMDPFAITRFVSTTTAQEIKEHFDEMEGKPVSIAWRDSSAVWLMFQCTCFHMFYNPRAHQVNHTASIFFR